MKTLEKYAFLKAKIKELNDQLKELEPAITEEVVSNGEPIKTNYGTFSLSSRKKITYSKSLQKKIAAIEKEKEIEVINGKAKVEEQQSLRFTFAKYSIPPGMSSYDEPSLQVDTLKIQ